MDALPASEYVVVSNRSAQPGIAQELPSWSYFRTDIRRVGWAVAADRFAREIVRF
jgi:hypothetical protein